MLMLPVSAFVALVLAWLAIRNALAGERPLLSGFLLACALQSFGVALASGYGVSALRQLLPISAALLPPLAWITFRSALIAPVSWREAPPHLGAPVFCLFCRLFAPMTMDVVVALIFVGYGAAILLALREAPDPPLARLEAGVLPGRIWRALGWALIASALSDALIAFVHASGRPEWTGPLISLASSLLLLALGLLSVSPEAMGAAEAPEPVPPPEDPRKRTAEEEAEDAALLARLDGFLARERAHLDPDLTLTRLARRLHLPEKRLSAAVNRATGGNLSRHVNGWRIRHACGLLEAGKSVTEAMLESGFNSKSNFNREFLRVAGTSPTGWLAEREKAKEQGGQTDEAAFLMHRPRRREDRT